MGIAFLGLQDCPESGKLFCWFFDIEYDWITLISGCAQERRQLVSLGARRKQLLNNLLISLGID